MLQNSIHSLLCNDVYQMHCKHFFAWESFDNYAHAKKAKRKKKMDFNFNESTNNSKSIYEGCLFVCDIEILQNHDAPLCTFDIIEKPLMIKGSLNWFHIVSPYGGKVIEY
jgi:hypothetical protein